MNVRMGGGGGLEGEERGDQAAICHGGGDPQGSSGGAGWGLAAVEAGLKGRAGWVWCCVAGTVGAWAGGGRWGWRACVRNDACMCVCLTFLTNQVWAPKWAISHHGHESELMAPHRKAGLTCPHPVSQRPTWAMLKANTSRSPLHSGMEQSGGATQHERLATEPCGRFCPKHRGHATVGTLEMRVKHASNSYRCITRLIVTGTRHHDAAWVRPCTNFVHSARTAHTQRVVRPPYHTVLHTVLVCVVLHGSLSVCDIYQEFGFGLAPFWLGIWTGTLREHEYWHHPFNRIGTEFVAPEFSATDFQIFRDMEYPLVGSSGLGDLLSGASLLTCDHQKVLVCIISQQQPGRKLWPGVLYSYPYIFYQKSAHQMPGLSIIVGV